MNHAGNCDIESPKVQVGTTFSATAPEDIMLICSLATWLLFDIAGS